MERYLEELVMVVHTELSDPARVDELCNELNRAGFAVMYDADTDRSLFKSGAPQAEISGIVFMDAPAISIRAFREQNPSVAVIAFGGLRSDTPGNIKCSNIPRLAARYMRAACEQMKIYHEAGMRQSA